MGQMRKLFYVRNNNRRAQRPLVDRLYNGGKPCDTYTKMPESCYAAVLDLCDLIFLTLTLQIVMKASDGGIGVHQSYYNLCLSVLD